MEQVRLGETGLHVSRVCLGMMSFYAGQANRAWMLDKTAAEPIVRRAVEAGSLSSTPRTCTRRAGARS
jgi:aryl-alcohol dehydrogenase-like predicted oxidoreductase